MALTGGRQVNLGVGIEATPGTAVAASFFPKWTDLSLQAISEKTHLKSARGIRNANSDSRIRRKYGKGSFSIVPNATHAAPLFYLTLGSISSAGVVDSSYTHTISVQEANASMKTATILVENGAVVTDRYANCVVDSLSLECSDDYAKLGVSFLGGFPDTGTVTESFTQPTEYAYPDYTAKFGTSFANAAAAGATPLKGFTLNINNNVLLDEAFLSGSVTPAAGAFVAGPLEITGSYTLQFSTAAERDAYTANTKKALIVTFTGALIGATSTQDLTIKLGKLILTSPPVEYNLDGIILYKQEFTVENDPTDGTISVVVRNATVSY